MWDALPTWRSVRRQTESLASRAYKQFTSVFPLPPSPKFLRNHSTTIVWAFVGLVALAYFAGGWGKRRLGLQSVPVAGFELTGTLGGGAPRRNARFEQIVSEGPEGIKTIEQLMRCVADCAALWAGLDTRHSVALPATLASTAASRRASLRSGAALAPDASSAAR